MTIKKALLFVLAILIIAALGGLVFRKFNTVSAPAEGGPVQNGNQEGQEGTSQNLTVEEYVRTNISALSPTKEVLGGKFYVTKIEAHGGAGTVEYEDGHIALVADFRYNVDGSGKVTVTSFLVRQ